VRPCFRSQSQSLGLRSRSKIRPRRVSRLPRCKEVRKPACEYACTALLHAPFPPLHRSCYATALTTAISIGPAFGIAASIPFAAGAWSYASSGVVTWLLSLTNLLVIWLYFDDNTVLNPTPKPSANGDAPKQDTTPVPRLLVGLCCAPVFLICLAYLGGYESALALIVNQWCAHGPQRSLQYHHTLSLTVCLTISGMGGTLERQPTSSGRWRSSTPSLHCSSSHG
jgi:hypothetical protein